MPNKIAKSEPPKIKLDRILRAYDKDQLAKVISLSGKLIKQFPNSIILLELLGLTYLDLGENKKAIKAYQKILQFKPEHTNALNNLGMAFYNQGIFDVAVENYQKAVQIEPSFDFAHYNLGNAQKQLGNIKKAIENYEASLRINPDDVEVLISCGNTSDEYGSFNQAIKYYSRALVIDPNLVYLRAYVDEAMKKQAEIDKFISEYVRVSKLEVHSAEVFFFIGSILESRGYLEASADSYRHAINISPDSAEFYTALGGVLHQRRDFDEAVHYYTEALRIKPDDAKGHFNIGVVLSEMGHKQAAIERYEQALQIESNYPEAACNIATILGEQGDHEGAIKIYEKVLSDRPEFSGAVNNLIYTMSQTNQFSNDDIFNKITYFSDLIEAPFRSEWPYHTNLLHHNKCLKIGFVSGDFNDHSVAKFVRNLFEKLKTYDDLELHAYYNNKIEDHITEEIKQCFRCWNSVYHLTDAKLACNIIEDEIDILIDLSNHTNLNRLGVFARKPAPLQVTSAGLPSTTGFSAIDYHFTSVGSAQNNHKFSECRVQLPSSVAFSTTSQMPPVSKLPAISKGFITFASFNKVGRISYSCLILWSKLLLAVPNSRFLFAGQSNLKLQDKFEKFFIKEGITLDRIDFHKNTNFSEYICLHHQVDIHLMAFPYSGGTTVCNAFLMGVPSLGLSEWSGVFGDGKHLLELVGLSDFHSNNLDEYITKGRYIAANLAELSRIRANLKDNFLQSAFCNPDIAAASWYFALRAIWKNKCSGLNPKPLNVTMEDLNF